MKTVNPIIRISEDDIVFKASRSSGPGGQNVNKVNTKISAELDIANCRFLGGEQKRIILKKLAGRLTKDGRLVIDCQTFRSQKQNRSCVAEKLAAILTAALKRPKRRKPTKPTVSSIERRLNGKKLRSKLKRERAPDREQ